MGKLHFEPKVDWTCVTELLALVKEKRLLEERQVAVDHACFLAGSINALIGQKPDVFAGHSVANELEGEGGLIAQLEEQLAAHKADEKGVVISATAPTAINPAFVALLKKIALLVLQELLSA